MSSTVGASSVQVVKKALRASSKATRVPLHQDFLSSGRCLASSDSPFLSSIHKLISAFQQSRSLLTSPPSLGSPTASTLVSASHHPALCIAGYWPMGDELDIKPVLRHLHEQGYTCALPVVVEKNRPLLFREWRPDTQMVPAGFGTLVPSETERVVRPDVLLVPLLSFDAEGYRLGYGGGFYDRTLQTLRESTDNEEVSFEGMGRVLAIGVGYAGQKTDATLPRNEYDQPLDAIVTPDHVAFISTRLAHLFQ